MNRIDKLFQDKKGNILSIYFTAGHPSLFDSVPLIKSLEKFGADMIEIGIPFSDPMADGPVIQGSNQVALNNGMTLKFLFEQLKTIRNEVKIPLILMGSLNPVMRFGLDRFCKKCMETGIDGVIIPDLPFDEYEENCQSIFQQNNLYNIFLVTPQTSEERIKKIDSLSNGFIYMVSTYSTTGSGKGINQSVEYFERTKNMKLKNPRMIGFGIKDKESFQTACEYANGAIIGTAFIKAISEGISENKVEDFVKSILQ